MEKKIKKGNFHELINSVDPKLREKWEKIQNEIKKNLIETDETSKKLKYIAGMDITFSKKNKNVAVTTIFIFDSKINPIFSLSKINKILTPYIPSFLAFREIDTMLELFEKANKKIELLEKEEKKLKKEMSSEIEEGVINQEKDDILQLELKKESLEENDLKKDKNLKKDNNSQINKNIKNLKKDLIPQIELNKESLKQNTLKKDIKKKSSIDLIFVDGNGILHPRFCGLATHLGVLTNTPTIGCAKTIFAIDGINKYKKIKEIKEKFKKMKKTGFEYLKGKSGKIWGAALKNTIKSFVPLIVSIGHKINIDRAIELVFLYSKCRVVEPIRFSDKHSRYLIDVFDREFKNGMVLNEEIERFQKVIDFKYNIVKLLQK